MNSQSGVSPSSFFLTIITIVKDDLEGLQRTMLSLQHCLDNSCQWLIIDSSSNKNEVKSLLNSSAATYDYAWVEPAGIFSAMNSGLKLAQGEYSWFMNAGDTLYSAGSLDDVCETLATRPVWAYGQVAFRGQSGRVSIPKPFDYQVAKRRFFSQGRFPPHQGTVARTDVLQHLGGFDESYAVAADYSMMLKLSLLGDPVESRGVWADFYEGGMSTVQWRHAIHEFHRARLDVLRPSGLNLVKERFAVIRELLRQSVGRLFKRVRGH